MAETAARVRKLTAGDCTRLGGIAGVTSPACLAGVA